LEKWKITDSPQIEKEMEVDSPRSLPPASAAPVVVVAPPPALCQGTHLKNMVTDWINSVNAGKNTDTVIKTTDKT
jgi:hypothetical protein